MFTARRSTLGRGSVMASTIARARARSERDAYRRRRHHRRRLLIRYSVCAYIIIYVMYLYNVSVYGNIITRRQTRNTVDRSIYVVV